MIRLIKRRLIIPRGDTGSFSIPTIGEVGESDVAIFSIFDPLTHKTLVMKKIAATQDFLTITFASEDTIMLEPRKYNWDITIYKGPIYDEEEELIGAREVNSYYSAFKLPICEITEVALDMNKDRWKTSTLTLDTNQYQAANNIQTVYPWENIQNSQLAKQIYNIAKLYGNTDPTKEEFWTSISKKTIVIDTLENFPLVGDEDTLYFDKNGGVLYYFVSTTNIVYTELAEAVGAIIETNDEEQITYLYIPIKAIPIENLILGGGEIE